MQLAEKAILLKEKVDSFVINQRKKFYCTLYIAPCCPYIVCLVGGTENDMCTVQAIWWAPGFSLRFQQQFSDSNKQETTKE